MAQQTKSERVTLLQPEVHPKNEIRSKSQALSEETVTFTSFDGIAREVGPLPENLARATALASERTLSKIWGTAEEEAACQDMQKEI